MHYDRTMTNFRSTRISDDEAAEIVDALMDSRPDPAEYMDEYAAAHEYDMAANFPNVDFGQWRIFHNHPGEYGADCDACNPPF